MIAGEFFIEKRFTTVQAQMLIASKQGWIGEVGDAIGKVVDSSIARHNGV
jgi:hypothetical protein